MKEKSESIKRLLSMETKNHTIKELMAMVDYQGPISNFRIAVWKYKIPYKKEREDLKQLKVKLDENKDTLKSMTIEEIKLFTGYKGSLYALFNILTRLDIPYKKTSAYRKKINKKLKEKIQLYGDTSKLSPQDIFDLIEVQVINPTAYLRRIEIPYRKRERA